MVSVDVAVTPTGKPGNAGVTLRVELAWSAVIGNGAANTVLGTILHLRGKISF